MGLMITKDLKILTTYTIVEFVHYSEVQGDILWLPHAVNPCPAGPAFANSVDPLIQINWLLKKPTDLDLHSLPFSI